MGVSVSVRTHRPASLRRWIPWLLGVAVVALAACGEGSAKDGTPAATSPTDAPTASSTHAATATPGQTIRLLFTGDIIPARCVYTRHLAYNDFRHAFLALGPYLSGADITVGSLDATLSDAGRPLGCVQAAHRSEEHTSELQSRL